MDIARRLRLPGYFLLAISGLLPLLDLVVAVWPIRLGTPVWRFGAVGLLAGGVLTPLLALFLILVLAMAAGDRKVVTLVGVLTAIGAVLMIGSLATFTLDALQTRARIQPSVMRRFEIATAQAFGKLVLATIASALISWSALKSKRSAARREAARQATRAQGPAASLLVGRPSMAAAPVAAAPVTAPESEEGSALKS